MPPILSQPVEAQDGSRATSPYRSFWLRWRAISSFTSLPEAQAPAIMSALRCCSVHNSPVLTSYDDVTVSSPCQVLSVYELSMFKLHLLRYQGVDQMKRQSFSTRVRCRHRRSY